jgi:dynein light intermediate chain
VQYASSTPATRLDVINLQERLDTQLQQRQVGGATGHAQ